MAMIIKCYGCGNEFATSASRGSSFCDECNGTNEAKRKEKERWNKLTDRERIDELLARVESIEKRYEYNPLIG